MLAPKYIFISLFQLYLIASTSRGEEHCAQLFSDKNYNGNKLIIENGEGISNLNSFSINSIKISNGCEMVHCNETDYNGECPKLENSIEDLSTIENGFKYAPLSATCNCKRPCDCSKIKLGRKECARGYLEKPCSDCSAIYTSFKESVKSNYLNRKFADLTISSLITRPGCTLSVEYANEEEKVNKIVEGGKIEDWSNKISEYRCTCDPNAPFTEAPIEINPNAPPLIEIPDKTISINSLLKKYQNHPGLTASLQSISNKRSGKNAYILLLGLTGSGKSSTINFLFDNSSITKVGDVTSTTSDIHEYRINVPVSELGMKNSELRIIDTPGLVDTRGLEQDAKFLATLDQYLSSHPDLKKSVPNVVLIFSKFNDNRFSGIGSNFVKMLRSIDLFRDRIIDKHFSNVIFVLTHTMSESKEILRNPQVRLETIHKVIDEYSLLPKPISIVLAENRPSDDVPMLNGFYFLPNNELYPKNLFEKIQLSTSAGGDLVGEAVIRTAFKSSLKGTSLKEEIIFPHVKPEHKKVLHYLGLLSDFNRNSHSTEVTKELDNAWKTLDETLRKENPNALGQLQRLLTLLNIREFKSLPATQQALFQFFQKVQKNPTTLELLEKGLNITIPEFETSPLIGYSFSVLKDQILPFNLVNISGSELYISESGFRLPSIYKCNLVTGMLPFFNIFPNKKAYVEHRLKVLGLASADDNSEDDKSNLLQNENSRLRAGYNLLESHNGSNLEQNRLSAVIEYRKFQLELDEEKVVISDELVMDLEKLQPFNEEEWEGVNAWREFFEKYGTHLIKTAVGGGSLEIVVENKDTIKLDNNEETALGVQEKLSLATGEIIDYLANLVIGKETVLDLSPSISYQLHFRGGNTQFYIKNLTSPQTGSNFNKWRESLTFYPIMLENELQLISLVNIVPEESLPKLEFALLHYFNQSLVYKVNKINKNTENVLEDRSSTGEGGSAGDYAMMKEFSNLFLIMSEKSKEANENMLRLIAESNEKNERQLAEDKEASRIAREEEAKRALEERKLLQEEKLGRQQREMYEDEVRRQREAADEAVEREERRFQRQEELAFQQLEAQKSAQMFQFIIEDNRRRDEARKNSFFNKVGDTLLGGAQSLISMAPMMAMAG